MTKEEYLQWEEEAIKRGYKKYNKHHPAMTILISRLSGRTMTDFNI